MSRIVFQEFIAVYNQVKGLQEEWEKEKRQIVSPQQQHPAPSQSDEDGDEADVRIQADRFFKLQHDNGSDSGLSDFGIDDEEEQDLACELGIGSVSEVVSSSSGPQHSGLADASSPIRMTDSGSDSGSISWIQQIPRKRRRSMPTAPEAATPSPNSSQSSAGKSGRSGRSGNRSGGSSDQLLSSPTGSLKSYSQLQTGNMMSRAIRELKFPPGYISTKSTYSWSISRMQLKEKIMGMKFFADPNLNNKMKEVLLREDCLSSPSQAVKIVARIYWSENEVVKGSIRLAQSGRRVNGMARDVVDSESQLTNLRDVHQLFMMLHGLGEQDWLETKQQYRVFQTIYAWKQQILQRRECSKHFQETQDKNKRARISP